MPLQELLKKIVVEQFSQLYPHDIVELAKLDRFHQLLVRCGNCRFTCAAQYAEFMVTLINESGKDYVRDVGLLATDPAIAQYKHLREAPKQEPLRLSGRMIAVPMGDG